MYALVDGNSFYASCEKVFRPDLWKKPVVVLSNNDGCIISLSKEAKDLGIPMGEPLFKVWDQLRSHGISVFSANFPLYADFSNRLVELYHRLFDRVEVYSIDESFLQLEDHYTTADLVKMGEELHQTALAWTGIPVSMGFGPTKTLAKVAHKLAKNMNRPVFVLPPHPQMILDTFPIGQVWGIGRRYGKALKQHGIQTAGQFSKASPQWVQKNLTIVGRRTQLELQGTHCIGLQENPDSRHSLLTSRSFGHKITDKSSLKGAMTDNVMTAHRKLVANGLVASTVIVFLATGVHDKNPVSKSCSKQLWKATDSVSDLLSAALLGIDELFEPGVRYGKSGLILLDLAAKSQVPISLFQSLSETPRSKKFEKMSEVMTDVNRKWGKRLLLPARRLSGKVDWSMNQQRKSPRYTTCWQELPRVQAH